MRWMPWRNAASRMFSSSLTSMSRLTGSKLILCESAMATPPGAAIGVGLVTAGGTAGGAGATRRWFSDRGRACAVLRDVRVPLGVGHLVQQHVGAVERVAAHVVEGPHLLRIQIQVRLPDERLAV